MQKILIFLVLLSGFAFAGCDRTSKQPNIEELIAKVRVKNDPQNRQKDVKTAFLKYTSLTGKEKTEITILLKRPGKVKIMTMTGKSFWECAFDGKKAWEYSNSDGLRYLTDMEQNEVRLQAFLLAPSIDIKKILKEIKFVRSAKIDGEDCWELSCQPADIFKSQAITVFVTKETNLIVRTIEKQDTAKAVVKVINTYKDYKMFKGFLLPTKVITESDNLILESTLIAVMLNQKISDEAFAAPKAFK